MPAVHSTPLVDPQASTAGDMPKWFWGAVIGGGVALMAVGTAYYVFRGGAEGGKAAKAKAEKGARKKAGPPTQAAASANGGPVKVEDLPDDQEEAEPTDPFEKALAAKNKGNKYFRGGRYELAIKCYSEAIDGCPREKTTDLSTFYQNRAAAFDQLENWNSVYHDCTKALELNSRYVKAMERRAKVARKMAEKNKDNAGAICNLKQALEDITAVCILEGFQKQEHLILVDTVLKELGRAEAKDAALKREPILTSKHFIQQYFQSFAEDPIVKSLEKESEGDVDESMVNGDNTAGGYRRALHSLRTESYTSIIPACSDEISSGGEFFREALVLRGTFYILSKQQDKAFADLEAVIADESASKGLRVNALIKRASLFIQQCKDPIKDPDMSFEDFRRAAEIDPENTDIYHHRGQVHLLTDQVDKAIADFSKAVELNPGFAIAYVQKLYTDYRKASLEQSQEKVNNIINLFELAVEKFPKCVETYALFAQVLSDQQKFDRADHLYQRAEKIDPHNANLFVHRGLIQLQWKGDVEKAVDLIRKALEVDDKCEFAYETLGTIEVQRGNLKVAVELFEKAIPLANTELEMAHLFGLKDAAIAQTTVSDKLGIVIPPMGML